MILMLTLILPGSYLVYQYLGCSPAAAFESTGTKEAICLGLVIASTIGIITGVIQ